MSMVLLLTSRRMVADSFSTSSLSSDKSIIAWCLISLVSSVILPRSLSNSIKILLSSRMRFWTSFRLLIVSSALLKRFPDWRWRLFAFRLRSSCSVLSRVSRFASATSLSLSSDRVLRIPSSGVSWSLFCCNTRFSSWSSASCFCASSSCFCSSERWLFLCFFFIGSPTGLGSGGFVFSSSLFSFPSISMAVGLVDKAVCRGAGSSFTGSLGSGFSTTITSLSSSR